MLGSKLKLRGLRIDNAVQETCNEDLAEDLLRPEPLRLVFSPSEPFGPGNLFMKIRFPPEGILDVLCRFRLSDGTSYYADLPRVGRNDYAGVISLPGSMTSVTLEVTGSGEPLRLAEVALQPLSGFRKLRLRARRIAARGMREVLNLVGRKHWGEGRRKRAQLGDYQIWRDRFDDRPDIDLNLHRRRANRLKDGPTISLITFVKSDLDLSKRTISSLKAQFYERWELIVLTEAFAAHADWSGLSQEESDSRITIKRIQKDYADACNMALAVAQGSFVGIIPPGAQLPAHALTEIAAAIRACPGTQLLYTDEDRIDANQRRHSPSFKPDWSPHFLRSHDYLGDLTLYRTETLRHLGGWRPLEGMEGYDLRLRLADDVASNREAVVHLPKVLIHIPETSLFGAEDITGHAQRLSEHGKRMEPANAATRSANRSLTPPRLPERRPLVSIIIPTRDQAVLLHACIRSILDRTDHKPYEIIVVDNGSQEPQTKRLFEEISRDHSIRILQYPFPFNYSAINNYAVGHAQGSFLALLNNDVEVVAGGWLSSMVAHASRPEIGCVGAKLLYPDGTVQHGGILMGVAGLAGHAHRNAAGCDPGHLRRLQSVTNVSAVTGACLVVRREIYEEVGGLDEIGLKTAFNDVDFCLKVREAGYLNLWIPDAVLVHHESKTRGYEWTRAKRTRLAREEEVMRRRWGRVLLEDPYYSRHLTRLTEDFRVRTV